MLNSNDIVKVSQSPFFQQQELQLYKTTIAALQATLIKPKDIRNTQDTAVIQQFMSISPFFRQLSIQFSIQFSRDIIRSGRVCCVKGRRRIFEKKQKMARIMMPLLGQFYHRTNQEQKHETTIFQKIQQLINTSKNYFDKNARSLQLQKKHNYSLQNSQIKTSPLDFKTVGQVEKMLDERHLSIDGLGQDMYNDDLFIIGQAWLFNITNISFWKCLLEQYQRRVIKKSMHFRKLKCFDIFNDQQLNRFVQKVPLVVFKKDEYVFKQGDASTHMYVLIEGSAKCQKTIALFKEDPNSLYKAITTERPKTSRDLPKKLQYVNFQRVFNYCPQNKRIDLGVLAPITIFGQEQVISSSISRQSDVLITSNQARLFVFKLKDVEIAGKKNIQSFIKLLSESITSVRVSTKRQTLSKSLNLHNQRNMNYFYINQQPTSLQNTSRTSQSRIRTAQSRINRSISTQNKRYESTSTSFFNTQTEIKPRYNHFNFDQFLKVKKKGVVRSACKLSREQQRVTELSHDFSGIQGMIEASQLIFTRQKINNHKINIENPLFDTQYYRNRDKQILRVQNMKRMRKLL